MFKKIASFLVLIFATYIFSKPFIEQSVINNVDAAVAGCFVYGTQDSSSTNTQLVRYDIRARTATPIGPELDGANIEAIDIHPSTRAIYGIQRGGANPGYLVIIDGASGAVTRVGNTGQVNVSSLAFRRKDNTLWAWVHGVGLHRVNIGTGALTPVYTADPNDTVESITWNSTGTILYFTREYNSELYAYNEALRTISVVDNLPAKVEGMDTLADGNLLLSVGHGSTDIEIFKYNPNSKQKLDTLLIGTNYYDLEGIAYPDNCSDPFTNVTPPPTPRPSTPRPSSTPTRSPTPRPSTPRPSSTPTRSPTPRPSVTRTPTARPTATPIAQPACAPDCSTKRIGTIDAFNNFTPLSDITANNPYWVRLEIEGPAPLATSDIVVDEQLNSSNFTLINPTYSASGSTFKIARKNGSNEIDQSLIKCPDANSDTVPDCVAITPTGMRITLRNILATETYYIYLQATSSGSGSNITVDNSASRIEYVGYGAANLNRYVPLDNERVDISVSLGSFFQIAGGDVFSASTDMLSAIKSTLPGTSSYFDTTNTSIIFSGGGTNWGSGDANQKEWQVKPYTVTANSNYNLYYSQYTNYIQQVDLKNGGPEIMTDSGYYIDQNTGANYKLVLDNNWSGKNIRNKQLVVFVPGDLQIDNSFTVDKNGFSSITFIVQGNIGISPSVARVEGIYLAEGAIDTSCNANFNSGSCNPDKNNPQSQTQLTLEGIFHAYGDGYVLDRSSSSVNQPGEIFIYRPDMLFGASTSVGQLKFSWKEDKQ
jgi:hypothetical protein